MQEEVIVRIDKLVHGGQGLATLPDGRKAFVWNVLPGEKVRLRIMRRQQDFVEGVAIDILKPSSQRIEPTDEAYLSTSPWQIMSYEAEAIYKQAILEETMQREKLTLPKLSFVSDAPRWANYSPKKVNPWDAHFPPGAMHYRNKMEYSFWGDDDGLHLALFHRAAHSKRIIKGSSIARPEIDRAANKVCAILEANDIRAAQLKSIVLRCDQLGNVVVALFVKDADFPRIEELHTVAKGLAVYYSEPKSPASVITKELYTFGDITLTDSILGMPIRYDVNSFFQVNLPIFQEALKVIHRHLQNLPHSPIIDMYAGVGTIGLPLGAHTLVEVDSHNVTMATLNAVGRSDVVEASTEKALEHITPHSTVIFDPPRAGLHEKVLARVLEAKPPTIVYLSCNPSTQARDLAQLQNSYQVTHLAGYNFFPRTPHIESLAILELK